MPNKIKDMFNYHILSGLTLVENERVRALFITLGEKIDTLIEDCDEKTHAFNHLQESLFWFLEAIKRRDRDKQERVKELLRK